MIVLRLVLVFKARLFLKFLIFHRRNRGPLLIVSLTNVSQWLYFSIVYFRCLNLTTKYGITKLDDSENIVITLLKLTCMDPHSRPFFLKKIPKCLIFLSWVIVAMSTTSWSENMAAISSVISGQVSWDRNGWYAMIVLGPVFSFSGFSTRYSAGTYFIVSGIFDQFWKECIML